MQQKFTEITNKTMIPISFVILIWYSINWLVTVKSKTELNARDISTITTVNEKILKQLHENTRSLTRIETILKNLERNQNDESF